MKNFLAFRESYHPIKTLASSQIAERRGRRASDPGAGERERPETKLGVFFSSPEKRSFLTVLYLREMDREKLAGFALQEAQKVMLPLTTIWIGAIVIGNSDNALQSGGSGCEKGFVKCFIKVPPAYLGGTAAAVPAQRSVELSQNILQNLFHNLTPQTVEVITIINLRRRVAL